MKNTAASDHSPQTPESVDATARMIDTWFPCGEVDAAVLTTVGSGQSEKALFTWFASRPIAQARAGVLCSLLPDTADNRRLVRAAVSVGNAAAVAALRRQITAQHDGRPPVVLDMFSGRAIIPLEAARAGARAIGVDLSPVAALAGRLLAEYPQRDWSNEPPLPFGGPTDLVATGKSQRQEITGLPTGQREPRLLADVRTVLSEVSRRVTAAVADYYPSNPLHADAVPWSYLWAVTIPCDGCGRRFPIIGSLVLRHP
jgi:adenine-specific DNA methylase